MRLNLNLEELDVQTTEMDPEYAPESAEAFDGGFAASILWDTQTRPIQRPATNTTPCYA
jgi:hypothetical protein